ncbi:hypothetical protein [Leifsonia sp. NPDC077715]|uniref:hypothetical protein n=1 Tax=Leifsonia sp. NPDC077715 TaxID=3155539 RepID=UPI00343A9314
MTLAGACVIGASLTGFAATDAAQTNAEDAVAALQAIAPQALSGVATTRGAEGTAVEAPTPEGASVEVPDDPSDGVTLGTPDDRVGVTIGLPFADQATDAAESQRDGVVVYDNMNGSSTVPVARSDGSAQIITVIDNAGAPKRYEYPVELPPGASLALADDGSVESVGAEDENAPVLHVATPWAKDANGDKVPTHYEVSGSTLTQVIDFTKGSAFPIVADPATYVDYTKSEVINLRDYGAQTKWRYLNGCSAAAGKSCSISRTYTVNATVETALNVSAATVGASIGVSAGAGLSVAVTCGISRGPASVSLYAQAVKKTYQVRTTRYYGVPVPGRGLSTQVKTSGTLTAYKPNGRYSCV